MARRILWASLALAPATILVDRLTDAGYSIDTDRERGAAAYERQRRRWDGHVRAFAVHMGHEWEDIEPRRCLELVEAV